MSIRPTISLQNPRVATALQFTVFSTLVGLGTPQGNAPVALHDDTLGVTFSTEFVVNSVHKLVADHIYSTALEQLDNRLIYTNEDE